MRRLALFVIPFLALAGCASDTPPSPATSAGAKTATPTGAEGQPSPMDAKLGGGSGSQGQVPPMMREEIDPAEKAKLEKELDGLKTGYETAKAAYEKKPNDAKAKDAFVVAAVKYGHESMMSPVLDAKVKYRQALTIYREVLKIDPNNEVAKPESDMIVSIYESMKRPVPK